MSNRNATAAILDADGRAVTGAEWLHSRKPASRKPDITLFNGTIVTHAPMANGATEAIVTPDGRAMSNEEWSDYCTRLVRASAGFALLANCA
jgi:hypothetical protein